MLLLLLGGFSFFYDLNRLSLRYWDEASYALNAWEMNETGEYINLYQFGKNDFYNTKPPLAIWCMALSMKVFGINEWAVRFPSAIFALLSVLWLFYFCKRWLNMPEAGLVAGLILLSSVGYVTEHGTRTGDTDAILAFFILFYTTIFYAYLQTGNNRYIWLTFAGLLGACLTKGIAGLPGLPIIILVSIYMRQVRKVFTNQHLYMAGILFVVGFVGYYLLREYKAPGFLAYMYKFEIGGRLHRQEFLNPEPRGFMYFFEQFFVSDKWMPWLLTILLWPIAFFKKQSPDEQKSLVFSLLVLLAVYTVLGISSTKNNWYDIPLYPALALVSGITFYVLISNRWLKYVVMVTYTLFFVMAFTNVLQNNTKQTDDFQYKSFLHELRNEKKINDTVRIVNADFYFPIHFYAKLDRYKGFPTFVQLPEDSVYSPNAYIVTFKEAREVDMKKRYTLDLIHQHKDAKLFRIIN